MQYSGLALLNHQAIRNHQIHIQNNTVDFYFMEIFILSFITLSRLYF